MQTDRREHFSHDADICIRRIGGHQGSMLNESECMFSPQVLTFRQPKTAWLRERFILPLGVT
jgi:hypothetical protein